MYADVTLNLNDRTDRRDHKRDDCTWHIHSQFSHSPNITKPIPNAIEQLLSKLYSLETICKESPIFYEKIWNESGYNAKLKYTLLISDKINKKTQKKYVIWFNFPFSYNISTNTGKLFLNSVNEDFPRKHKLHKVFGSNNLKISCSCMGNMKTLISNQNSKVLLIT